MHDFKYRKGQLYCEGVSVTAIAKKVGTPFYLYSHKTLVDHFTKIQKAFAPVKPLICYSMKSNGNLAIIRALVHEGAGIDIVSGGELQKAVKASADPKKMVFASVGKTDNEIALGIRLGILLFNVESAPELETLNRIAKTMGKKVQAAIRINPDVDAVTHQAITTGTLKNKFGIDLKNARALLKARSRFSNVTINGLHIHIGSQIVSQQPFIDAIKKMIAFIDSLKKESIPLKYFDIGGGLGIIYKNEKPQTAKAFAKAVLPYLKKTGLQIIMEPGRFISGNAGIFVTRVLYLKNNGFKNFVIVDGGMNDLIRPALYHAYHNIWPVKKTSAKRIKADVVGPICESGDFFAKDRLLPKFKRNDLLSIMSAGAYGFAMASNYNVRCRPPEVMVKGHTFAIIRERETLNDLLRREKIPSFIK